MNHDDLNISNYIKNTDIENDYSVTNNVENYSFLKQLPLDAYRDAKEWGEQNMREIIYDVDLSDKYDSSYTPLDKLEDMWTNFNHMILKHRRESDWKALELYKVTNRDMYNFLKSKYINFPLKYTEIITEVVYDSVDYSNINYGEEDIQKAIDWMTETGKIMIIPTYNLDKLEDMWTNFNHMILKHRRESDWASIDIFGITNMQHYEYLKSKYIKNFDIDEKILEESIIINKIDNILFSKKYLNSIVVNESASDIFNSVSLIINDIENNPYQERIISNTISDIIDKRKEEFNNIDNLFIPYNDLPFFTPEEMIDFGVFGTEADNYFGAKADNYLLTEDINTKEWFKNYIINFNGYESKLSKSISPKWIQKLRELYLDLDEIKESNNKNKLMSRYQSILELGWNPYVDFNEYNRVMANKRIKSVLIDGINKFNFLDLRNFNSDNNIINTTSLHPIYIVLSADNIVHNIGISFSENLNSVYSFRFSYNKNTTTPIFAKENIYKQKTDNIINVFSIIVNEDTYIKIKNKIEWLENNYLKLNDYLYYSIPYIFNIANYTGTFKACVLFIDNLFKLCKLNISNKDNSNIYIVYSGLISKYNKNQIKNNIYSIISPDFSDYKILDDSILSKSITTNNLNDLYSIYRNNNISNKGLKTIYEFFIKPLYINIDIKTIDSSTSGLSFLNKFPFYTESEQIKEAKNFPITVDNDNNLLINLEKIDTNEEYFKTHRLLKRYEKAQAYDPMKYELARMWNLSIICQEKFNKLRNKKRKTAQDNETLRDLMIQKSRIEQDIAKYLDIILEHDSTFNFEKYYKKSEFNKNEILISKNTLIQANNLLKALVGYFW